MGLRIFAQFRAICRRLVLELQGMKLNETGTVLNEISPSILLEAPRVYKQNQTVLETQFCTIACAFVCTI